MKKFIPALPVVALSLFLAFCAKENNTLSTSGAADQPTIANTDVAAGDRADCTLTILSDNDITICGLGGNNTPCTTCFGQQAKGILGPGTGPFTVDVTGTAPLPFCITAGSNGATVRIMNSTFGLLGVFQFHPGQCRCFAAGCAEGIISDAN